MSTLKHAVTRSRAKQQHNTKQGLLKTEVLAFAAASVWLSITIFTSKSISAQLPIETFWHGNSARVANAVVQRNDSERHLRNKATAAATVLYSLAHQLQHYRELHNTVVLSSRNKSISYPEIYWPLQDEDTHRPPVSKVIGNATYATASNPHMVVVYDGTFFGKQWPTQQLHCSVPCVMTSDVEQYGQRADVVVHHAVDLDWDRFWETPKPPHQLWALHSMESEAAYTVQQPDSPVWKRVDIQANYKFSAVKPGLHHVAVPYLNSQQYGSFQLKRPAIYNKTGLALWMHNNCDALSSRQVLIQQLMELMPIDSPGKCLNNMDAKGLESTAPLNLMAQYKFYFVFENVFGDPDWVSSTFFRALDAGTVPVVLGAPNVLKFAPAERSVIRACDFDSQQDLVGYLMYLNTNNTAYREYLAWKEIGPSAEFQSLMRTADLSPWCQMCVAAASTKPWAYSQRIHDQMLRHFQTKQAFDTLNAQLDKDAGIPCRGKTAWWHVELSEEEQAKLWRVDTQVETVPAAAPSAVQ